MRGLCDTAKSARAIDCKDGSRFPYYPSKQEKRIFEYVFFGSAASFSGLANMGKYFVVWARCVINAASIGYNLTNNTKFLELGGSTGMKALIIVIAALFEASGLLVAAVTAAYFGLVLCCDYGLVDDDSSKIVPSSPIPTRTEARDTRSMLRAMAAYRVFCARSLADSMRKIADWNLLLTMQVFDARQLAKSAQFWNNRLYGEGIFKSILWVLIVILYYSTMLGLLMIAVYAKLQPLKDIIGADFVTGWTWAELLSFIGFINNLKGLSDSEQSAIELLQFSCVGHYTPYTDGADEGLAEKLVLQWYFDNLWGWSSMTCQHKHQRSSCPECCPAARLKKANLQKTTDSRMLDRANKQHEALTNDIAQTASLFQRCVPPNLHLNRHRISAS